MDRTGGQQPFSGKSHPLKIAAVDELEHKDTATFKENDYSPIHFIIFANFSKKILVSSVKKFQNYVLETSYPSKY